MEGDNAYFCEEVGQRVSAVRRCCIKQLPSMLAIHLKRFEFDHHTQTRYKVRDRFEFPVSLDMLPYTAEGLAAMETQNHPEKERAGGVDKNMMRSSQKDNHLPHPRWYYGYKLKGVVVHSGSAFTGHYYSFIEDRGGDAKPNLKRDCRTLSDATTATKRQSQWYCFDDKTVSSWDLGFLEQDCYGGRSSQDRVKGAMELQHGQDVEKAYSAYMLFYEREGVDTEHVDGIQSSCVKGDKDMQPMVDEAVVDPVGVTNLQTCSSNSKQPRVVDQAANRIDRDIIINPEPSSSSSQQANNPESILPYGMSANLFNQVMEDNVRLMLKYHLLDKDYFRFARAVVDARCDRQMSSSNRCKTRRTGSLDSLDAHSGSSSIGGYASDMLSSHADMVVSGGSENHNNNTKDGKRGDAIHNAISWARRRHGLHRGHDHAVCRPVFVPGAKGWREGLLHGMVCMGFCSECV